MAEVTRGRTRIASGQCSCCLGFYFGELCAPKVEDIKWPIGRAPTVSEGLKPIGRFFPPRSPSSEILRLEIIDKRLVAAGGPNRRVVRGLGLSLESGSQRRVACSLFALNSQPGDKARTSRAWEPLKQPAGGQGKDPKKGCNLRMIPCCSGKTFFLFRSPAKRGPKVVVLPFAGPFCPSPWGSTRHCGAGFLGIRQFPITTK